MNAVESRTLPALAAADDIRRGQSGQPVDYDLQGLLGIRLAAPSAADAAMIGRRLGLAPTSLRRAPDITIRFVERLRHAEPVRYLGLNDAGFSGDAFVIAADRHGRRMQMRWPFESSNGTPEVICESGARRLPLLTSLINRAMLARGVLPLHASAFRFRGAGVLVTGWTKGGKTEALLAFAANGAEYIGDEWVYLTGDGRWLHGVPMAIRVWEWHLASAPEYRRRIGGRQRARLRALAGAQSLARLLPTWRRTDHVRHRLLSRLERERHVDARPAVLFPGSPPDLRASFDKLFFVVSHDSPEVTVAAIHPDEVADRMAASLEFEELDLVAAYLKYRFARPTSPNGSFERAAQQRHALLRRILADKNAHVVAHPYPVHLPRLFDAMQGLVPHRIW